MHPRFSVIAWVATKIITDLRFVDYFYTSTTYSQPQTVKGGNLVKGLGLVSQEYHACFSV